MKSKVMKRTTVFWCGIAGAAFLGLAATGCRTVYNSTMENVFGYEKRELFKESVTALQSEQKDAQKEFQDALTRLKQLYGFQGGELESVYEKVKDAYDRCDGEAKAVHTRIGKMEDLAHSMFNEWEKEIGEYSNPNLAFSGSRGINYGFASAITIVIFFIVGAITLFQFRYTRMWEEVSKNV